MRPIPMIVCAVALTLRAALAQEPVSWGDELAFQTFSIAALDPATGQTGVAVTTRVACVGNAVPWVRAGVGAVATQAFTRVEYGMELLDLLEQGLTAEEALRRATGSDTGLDRRQVGVISLGGQSAQHTGDSTSFWAGHVAGSNFVTQGNLLTGPEVLEAVGTAFERTENSGRHLADRLIAALAAGQAAGGDARKGRAQSAAVVVADPREGASRRPDGVVTNINVCEHATPVAELRRIYDAVSETLGFRPLQQHTGRDVWQLRIILQELGYYHPDGELPAGNARYVYSQDLVDAVDAFRAASGLSTPDVGSPPGLVDAHTVDLLWRALEDAGRAPDVRARLLDITAIRR